MYHISNNQKPENESSSKQEKDSSLTSWSFGSTAIRDAWVAAIRRVESVVSSEENACVFAYFGRTFEYPVMRGYAQHVSQLLLAGASYCIPDKERELRPMYVAAERGHVGVIKVADRFQNIAIISVIPNMVKAGYRG
jgi:hypothetical protein